MTTEDLHKRIEAMEVGAELDALAATAMGWPHTVIDAGKAFGIKPGGNQMLDKYERIPRFSSDPSTIGEMLDWAKAGGLHPSLFQGVGDDWMLSFRIGDDTKWASGNTINLACARAIVKTAGRVRK